MRPRSSIGAPPNQLEVFEVSVLPTDREILVGHSIDSPKQGSLYPSKILEIEGWVLGARVPVVAVEVLDEGFLVDRVAVGLCRPDVARVHSVEAGATACGFRAAIPAALAEDLDITLRAVLSDQRRVSLGRIQARRARGGSEDANRVPLVSVVIPCFNQARFLGEAIQSVLNQSWNRLELVVVDDESSDNTEPVARRYPGVRFHRLSHGGVSAARNFGIRLSRGDFVVFLDADDRLLPAAIEIGATLLWENPQCAFVFGRFRAVTITGSPILESTPLELGDDSYSAFLRGNALTTTAAGMFRKSVFRKTGVFKRSLSFAEDYDLHLRICRRFPVLQHAAIVSEYRRHATGASRDLRRILGSVLGILHSQGLFLADRQRRRARAEGVREWRRRLEDAAQSFDTAA